MTELERKQRALLDRVEDERFRIRVDRFRRGVRLVAWSLAAATPLTVIAWVMDGAMIVAHPVWAGLAFAVVALVGHGVAGEVLRWLRAHEFDVRRLRQAVRDHRDGELDGWDETRRKDLRSRQRLLDDLDDARDDLRRTVRQLIGSAVAAAVFAGAVAAEIWWFGEPWPPMWTARLLIVVTILFGMSAVDVMVSAILSRRLASAKANLLAARRRHRDSALYDAKPSGHRRDVVELPPITHSGRAAVAPAVCCVLYLALVILSHSATVTGVGSPPDSAASPSDPTASPSGFLAVPTKLAARRSSVPVNWLSGVAVSPDGRRAFFANAGQPDRPATDVAVVDLSTEVVTATIAVPPRPRALALTPDGRRLVVASTGSREAPAGALSIVDTATQRVVSTIRLKSTPSDVAVSPDGRTAWCVIEGAGNYTPGAAVAVDLTTARVVGSVRVGADPVRIAVAPDADRAYVSNFDDGTVSVVNTKTRRVAATVKVGAGPFGLVVDHRRHTVWVAGYNEPDPHRTLTAIDTTTLAATPVDLGPPPPGAGGAISLALTPDGRRLLVVRYSSGSDPLPLLNVVDPDTRRVTDVITMPWADRIATAPDSHHAYLSSGSLWVLDIP